MSETIAALIAGSRTARQVLDLLVDEDIVLGTVRSPNDDGPDVIVCGHDGGRWIAWRAGQTEHFAIGESLSHALLEIGLEGVINEVVH